jgi:hypothetical protein
MNSIQFKILEAEIDGLIKGLLPTDEVMNDINFEQSKYELQIKSFFLLTHAALENYFE